MNKKLLVFPLAFFATFTVVGCSSYNPNKEFMNAALEQYKNLRKNLNIADDENYEAWYFDSELLKGAVFTSLTDYEYLGIINLQTMSFSETSDKYFLDIPNYDVGIDFENNNFVLPEEFQDPVKLITELPLVLVENVYEEETNTFKEQVVYSKFNEGGLLSTTAYKENYDPTFFLL